MKTFIELGACDFDNFIPLLQSGWKGFFIEPIPIYMESLKQSLESKNLLSNCVFEQSAITNRNGLIDMVFVSNPDEEWKRGISHVKQNPNKKQNYTSDLITYNQFENETIKVPAMTLNSFVEKHKIDQIDLLKIDIEGHELVVLESYDWEIKPKFLKIEHKFIDHQLLINLLERKGYFVWKETDDLYAILIT